MHRRVIYQALAWVPIAAGAATIAFTTTSHQLINKTVIYEDRTTFTQTPVAPAETITADKWYQPLTVPTRRTKPVAVVLAGVVYGNFTPTAETITVDKWHQPLAIPTRRARQVAAVLSGVVSPLVPPAGDATLAFTTTSHQRIDKTVLYEESAYTPYTPVVAEEVTIDKWWRELDRPVRRRQITAEEGSLFASPPKPEAGDQIAWHRQLDWPTRRKVVVAGAYSAAPPRPEAKDQIAWRRDLDLPPRVKRLPVTAGLSFVAAAPGAGTAYNWFSAIDLPTRLKRSLQTEIGYVYFLPPSAEEVTVDKWWRELDRPVRRRVIVVVDRAYSSAPPIPQANDQIGWYRAPETPTRAKRLPLGAIPFEARNAFPVIPGGWYAKLDEPLRIKRTPTGQVGYIFVAPAPSAGIAYNWFASLDEPLRIKRTPKTVLTWSSFTPAPTEVVTIDKWWRELDRPTRRTKPVPQQMGYSFIAAAPGRGVAYNWFQPLDVPVRARKSPKTELGYSNFTPPPRGLAATSTSAQVFRRSFIFDPTAIPIYFVPPTAGAGNEMNWWPSLNEPVRPRHSIRSAQQWTLSVPPRLLTTTLENAWFQRLSEPVRLKIGFGKYPGGSVQGNINPVVPLARSWVDEPRRLRGKYNFPAVVQANIEPVVPIAWQPLHVPHRLKGRVNYPALAQQAALYPSTVEVGKFTLWWRQLDLPVREWRKVAWQWSVTVPPTGVAFFNEGGPADESERVVCVPSSSRTATEPALLRTATVPAAQRTAIVPVLLRVATVPDQVRVVASNDYRDRPCHDI